MGLEGMHLRLWDPHPWEQGPGELVSMCPHASSPLCSSQGLQCHCHPDRCVIPAAYPLERAILLPSTLHQRAEGLHQQGQQDQRFLLPMATDNSFEWGEGGGQKKLHKAHPTSASVKSPEKTVEDIYCLVSPSPWPQIIPKSTGRI